MRISRGRTDRASVAARAGAALLVVILAGCGGRPAGVEAPQPGPASRAYTAAEVYTVEVGGAQAPDTVVTFLASRARDVVLRHGPPDNTVFAELEFPAGALVPPGGRDSVTITIRPVPGIYGITLSTDATLNTPARLTFKYPVHFTAPADSRTRYPTDVLFEQALVVAQALDDGARFQTLRSSRPASDNLQAVIATPGRYQMVAPR